MGRAESMGAMKVLEGANLAVRFALEMSAVAAAAYWGFQTGSGVMRWALAAAAALVATGHQGLALTFAVVALVSGTLNYVWDQRGRVVRT